MTLGLIDPILPQNGPRLYTLALIKRLGVIVALGGLLVGLAIVAVVSQISQQTASDYARAAPCPSSVGADCYQEVSGRISRVSFANSPSPISSPRYGIYTIMFAAGDADWTTQVTGGALPGNVIVGQEIKARVWRKNVVQVTVGGWTARTLANPSMSPGGPWLPLAILATIVGVVAGTALHTRKRIARASGPRAD